MQRTQLRVGDTIPSIWARDIRGKMFDTDALNANHTLLVFLRYAGCPFCSLTIYLLSQEYATLQKQGCDVVVFVQSSTDTIEKYIFGRHEPSPKFPIIPDHDKDFYNLFTIKPNPLKSLGFTIKNSPKWLDSVTDKGFKQGGVNGDPALVPSYFLVNRTREIELVDYSAELFDQKSFEVIYDKIRV